MGNAENPQHPADWLRTLFCMRAVSRELKLAVDEFFLRNKVLIFAAISDVIASRSNKCTVEKFQHASAVEIATERLFLPAPQNFARLLFADCVPSPQIRYYLEIIFCEDAVCVYGMMYGILTLSKFANISDADEPTQLSVLNILLSVFFAYDDKSLKLVAWDDFLPAFIAANSATDSVDYDNAIVFYLLHLIEKSLLKQPVGALIALCENSYEQLIKLWKSTANNIDSHHNTDSIKLSTICAAFMGAAKILEPKE
ncbi:MAG: hypothetical protein M0R33_14000 [Methylomonas sp.]|nr:hypothetical protein [Methylomonas sp.]